MDPFNNNFQNKVTGTSDTHKKEPSTDCTRKKTSTHGVGRFIAKAKPNSHLQPEARRLKNGSRLPSLTSLFSWVISKIKPKAQLKNQQAPVINMSASDFKKALENNQFSEFKGQVMVADDLDLIDLAWNTKLPDKLYVQGRLNLTNAKIKRLPSRLYVGGEFQINGCSHFPSGCKFLEVGKNLDLSGNSYIKKLPEQLHVPGSLILNDCKNLKTLSKKLYVGKDLQVRDCYNLNKIPKNMKVAGNLDFTNCVQLSKMPDTILQRPAGQNTDNERHIYCNGTGITYKNTSKDIADRENTTVHWSQNSSQTLKSILTWMKKNESFEKLPNLNLTPDQDNILSLWIGHLRFTREFTRNSKGFQNRILNILQQIADDTEFKTYFFDTQYYSTTSCEDRRALGVGDFELKIFVSEANKLSEHKCPESEKELKKMGSQMFRLHLLEKYIQSNFIALRRSFDPIEDMLYVKIHFKTKLDLPVNMHHMDYRRCVNVKDSDLDAIEHFVNSQSTPENLSEFLQNWEPWQRYYETGRFYTPKYDDLKQCPPPDAEHQECPIRLETQGNMVFADGQSYNFDALIEWWRHKPTLPHNPSKAIDWNNIQRWHPDDNLTDNDEVTTL